MKLSTRGEATNIVAHKGFSVLQKCLANPWTPENPTGGINLNTAVNHLCADILQQKFDSESLLNFDPEFLDYAQFAGTPKTQEVVADFLQTFFKANGIINGNIIMLPGIGSAMDALCWALFDPGDIILSPAPCYDRFEITTKERAGVIWETFPMKCENGEFSLNLELLTEKYSELEQAGSSVKGLMLVNPNNPLSKIHSAQETAPILEFAKKKGLIVFFNESYALSVYDDTFSSALSQWNSFPDPQRSIWMWGFSKVNPANSLYRIFRVTSTYLSAPNLFWYFFEETIQDFCLPGSRIGFVYSVNPELNKCLKRLSYYNPLSLFSQQFATKLLSDKKWLREVYFPTNLNRLRSSRDFAVERLGSIIGLNSIHPAGSGFFLFLDLSKLLPEETFQAEDSLFERLCSAGIFMKSGRHLSCPKPGWFRFVFTLSRPQMTEALDRLEKVLTEL